MIRAWLATLCALAVALTAPLAAGAAPKRIAVANAATHGTVAVRLDEELTALGFAVVDVDPWPDDASLASVRAALARHGATAAVRVGDDTADVWVVDPSSRTPVLCEVIRGESSGVPEDVAVALRAVERIRAEILVRRGLRAPPRAPPDSGRAADPAEGSAPVQRRPFAFEMGLGVSASPGGLDASAAFVAGAAWWPTDRFGLSALVAASPSPSVLAGLEGKAEVRTGLFGGGVVVSLVPSAWSFSLRLEAGAAACWLDMVGFARAPYAGGSDTLFTAAGYVRPRAALRIAPAVWLQIGALVGIATPEPVIAFAGRQVASWGRPLFVTSAGVEISP